MPDPLPLRADQVEDLAILIANPRHLLLSDPGTGKTPTVCVLARYHARNRSKKVLWVMPQSLMKKNREELLRFTDLRSDEIEILTSDHAPLTKSWTGPKIVRQVRTKKPTGNHGPDGKPLIETVFVPATFKDLIAASKAKVFIATFAFLRLHDERLIAAHPEIDCVIVDESHMAYGGPDSAQTHALHRIMRHAKHFCPMTGTLIDGRLDTAFPAIHIVEPRYYGSYAGFLAEHAAYVDERGKVLAWRGEDKLRAIIERHSIRRTFEDVYGKEPVVFQTELVEMNPSMRKSYDQFHVQAMLELEDGHLDGSLPGVAVIRARQIMGHPESMKLAAGEVPGKDERLLIRAAEQQPMLVFASLVPEQERLKKVLTSAGRKVGLINGNVSAAERDRIDKGFTSGQLDCIVASAPTAAVGYNWERADLVIFVSMDYKDVNALQAYRRASRGTRTKPLRVIFLGYEDSIDQRIWQILKQKSELANKVDPTRAILDIAA